MRLDEIFSNYVGVQATIDGGLPTPVVPAYGEDKYGQSDEGRKKIYNAYGDVEDIGDREGELPDDDIPNVAGDDDVEERYVSSRGKVKARIRSNKEVDMDMSPNVSDTGMGMSGGVFKSLMRA